ncbi:hypothetical protein [Paractinoplanes lichenicola]|uniref:Uncharacterized protein n=1 Tax=Paractinoplanes lichenicola TaxID=2802976 RepID=A0ABS1W0H8_9ACTN|nr:hypothetical protein [Actinoplanes lichenicola]MBL7260239.1 hypothetical protein [Actinoplanes lichenicola]
MRPRHDLIRRLLPWAAPALAAWFVLHQAGTPDLQIAVYAGYFLVAVVVPGTLVLRACYGSRGNWPEDLGLGAALGLVLQLVGWALAAVTGSRLVLFVWLAAILVVFAAVPRLRRHWRIESPTPLPPAWSWGIAAVLLLVCVWAVAVFDANPLPPVTFSHHQDVYYHLGLIYEMTRSAPFHVPHVAEETLRYHYLSDADMAAASMITGISPVNVYLRLWLLPVVGVGVLVFAVLARTVSGRWWTGPVAAALGFAGQALTLRGPISPFNGGLPISLVSPSQTYVLPLVGLFTVIAVEALRGKSLRWTWAILPLLAVACAGAKSSALPPLFAGIGLAGLVLLLARRRMPWTAVGLLGVIGFGTVVGFGLFAGGGAGTLVLQPLALLRWMDPYEVTLGTADGITQGGFLPSGVANASAAGGWFVAWMVVWWFLMQAPRLLGLVVRRRRRDAEAGPDADVWLLGGMVFAGAAATWLFWHPAASQGYFFTGVMPIGAVLTVCVLATRAKRLKAVVAGAAAGAVWVVLMPQTREAATDTIGAWSWALAVPLLITAAVTAVVAAVTIAVWRARAVRALPAALIAAVVGASLGTGITDAFGRLNDAPPPVNENMAVTAAEMRAARWLDANAARDDLVATNVHCMPMNAKKLCNARAFWVAGLTGRRMLIESWGYSDLPVAAHGVNGLAYNFQPAPYPEVYELNQRAFQEGDAADVGRLRDEHGVRWLFADKRAGTVAPSLAGVATVRYTNGPVTIYELAAAR